MTVTLATSDGVDVTMRVVSPVYFDGGVLIFTAHTSRKSAQMYVNPHCCIGAGIDYVLAEASTACSGITKYTTTKITSQHG